MITYVRTNIFESNAKVLVNTVNTVGVMGKGLALEFKNRLLSKLMLNCPHEFNKTKQIHIA
jgi:O-acetyl-ADP-ribose deacetylase (regulator of RNase III)